jgi:membrane associated rhomboid family serine protease
MVVLVSGFFSGLSILFYNIDNTTSGISGVAFGLGAVFFTDEKNLTYKEWIYAILSFLFLALILSYQDFHKMQKIENIDLQVDYIGHFLGAFGAIVYTRLVRY